MTRTIIASQLLAEKAFLGLGKVWADLSNGLTIAKATNTQFFIAVLISSYYVLQQLITHTTSFILKFKSRIYHQIRESSNLFLLPAEEEEVSQTRFEIMSLCWVCKQGQSARTRQGIYGKNFEFFGKWQKTRSAKCQVFFLVSNLVSRTTKEKDLKTYDSIHWIPLERFMQILYGREVLHANQDRIWAMHSTRYAQLCNLDEYRFTFGQDPMR